MSRTTPPESFLHQDPEPKRNSPFAVARAVGFTGGGVVADTFRIINTFQITLGLLIFSTFFSFFFLPYIAPTPVPAGTKKGGCFSFLDSLKVFLPRKVDGKRRWSLTALGVGEFLAALATGWVPSMLSLVRFGLLAHRFRPAWRRLTRCLTPGRD